MTETGIRAPEVKAGRTTWLGPSRSSCGASRAFGRPTTSGWRRSSGSMAADVVTVEKVDRINARARRQQKRDGRADAQGAPAGASGDRRTSAAAAEHKAAFEAYVRRRRRGGLSTLEAEGAVGRLRRRRRLPGAATRRSARSAGGLPTVSPIRAIAGVRQMSSATSTRSPSRSRGRRPAGSARRRARPQTDDRRRWPSSASRRWSSTPCRRRRQTLLDDAAVNIDEWIAEEVERRLRRAGGHGLRDRRRRQQADAASSTTPRSPRRAWAWGKIGYIATGVAGGFAAADPVRQADRPRLRAEGRLPAERAAS